MMKAIIKEKMTKIFFVSQLVMATSLFASFNSIDCSASRTECGYYSKSEAETLHCYGYLEPLLWTVVQGDDDYLATDSPNELATDQNRIGIVGKLKTATFDWNVGLRVGVGSHLCYYNADLEGNYLFFQTQGHNKAKQNPAEYNNGTYPTLIIGVYPEFTSTPVFEGKSHIKLNYKEANLIISKKINIDCFFNLKYTLGVTASWLEQDWRITYVPSPDIGFGSNNVYIDEDWSYFGGGLKIGLCSEWNYNSCLSFVGNFSLSLLYGPHRAREKVHVVSDVSSVQNYYLVNSKLSQNLIVPHYVLSLGPQYVVNCWNCQAKIYALYEMNLFQNIDRPLASDVSSSPVDGKQTYHTTDITGFHGLTLGFSAWF